METATLFQFFLLTLLCEFAIRILYCVWKINIDERNSFFEPIIILSRTFGIWKSRRKDIESGQRLDSCIKQNRSRFWRQNKTEYKFNLKNRISAFAIKNAVHHLYHIQIFAQKFELFSAICSYIIVKMKHCRQKGHTEFFCSILDLIIGYSFFCIDGMACISTYRICLRKS